MIFSSKTTTSRWRKHLLAGMLFLSVAGGVAQAFEVDFHYYTIYYLLRAKGYSTNTAHTLAGFSQYVDDNYFTEPLYCNEPKRAFFHFAASGPSTATTNNSAVARAQLTDAFARYLSGDPDGKYVAGAALHLLADTFSHQGFTAWYNVPINHRTASWRPCIGHANDTEKGKAPDRPYNHANDASEAARAIYQLLPDGPDTQHIIPLSNVLVALDKAFALQASRSEDRTNIAVRVEFMVWKIVETFPGEPRWYSSDEFARESGRFNAAVRKQYDTIGPLH